MYVGWWMPVDDNGVILTCAVHSLRQYLRLMPRLAAVMPPPASTTTPLAAPLDSFFLVNSGAEAVEAAIKLARHATKRHNLIVFRGAFHGRSLGTMGLSSSKHVFRKGYGPGAGGVHVAPFPYCCQCRAWERGKDQCCQTALMDFDRILDQESVWMMDDG